LSSLRGNTVRTETRTVYITDGGKEFPTKEEAQIEEEVESIRSILETNSERFMDYDDDLSFDMLARFLVTTYEMKLRK
jgi:hypothetical protein